MAPDLPPPVVIAHRGAHADGFPENSLAAFERAIELGADMIEFDVRRTAGGELIIFHDEECGGLPVAQLTRTGLAQRSGLLAPLLSETLALAAGRVALDVELKEDGYVERVVAELVTRSRGGGWDGLIVTSFLDAVLAQVAALAPRLCGGLLIEDTAQSAVERALACGAGAIAPAAALVSDALLDGAASAGLRCIVWDFNCVEHAALLTDARVDGVITDDVSAALAARCDSG